MTYKVGETGCLKQPRVNAKCNSTLFTTSLKRADTPDASLLREIADRSMKFADREKFFAAKKRAGA